ncbi:hypothetical protein, partial [Beijerinckia sp. L45]|uniref:hypothetical protein n=1 Tax=Beijerinckia sp. L45 TaxID=1641855 RepID=UPI00131E407C
ETDKTAHLAAQVLADAAWDGSTADEINAILLEADIEPAAIEALRDDIIAVSIRARRNAYYREKCHRWSII